MNTDVAPGLPGVPTELVQSRQGLSPCWGIALGPHPWSPVDAGSGDAAGREAPAVGGELWDPPARHWVLVGLDPPRHCPPQAGAGLGGTGSPVGSDFSPGSSARLPPHSCPLPLLLLAGGACPSSGPIPGTWPSLPKAAPTPPPCTAPLMPSAFPGPRGVMSGETPDPPPGAPMGHGRGGGERGTPLARDGGVRGGCLLACSTPLLGIPPRPAAALPFPLPVYSPAPGRKGRWLGRSRPGAAESQCPVARVGRSRVARATHALCACAHSPYQCHGSLGAAPKPRGERQAGAVLACAPLSRGTCVCWGGGC